MAAETSGEEAAATPAERALAALDGRHLALVGLMGSGKTSVGRLIAEGLGLPFRDSDATIERETGRAVSDIFADDGESAFRAMEADALRRILADPAAVVATGGGAFLQPRIRRTVRSRAVSVWLRAGLDLLDERTRGRKTRPLLDVEQPRLVLARLMKERHPYYGKADVVVDSNDIPKEEMMQRVLNALARHRPKAAPERPPRRPSG